MLSRSTLLVLAAASLVGGCDTYNPDLGPAPFRCGSEQPRCPEGYSCVQESADRELCIKDSAPGSPDSGPLPGSDGGTNVTCADDSEIEPNDDRTTAFVTPIPGVSNNFRLAALAICPASDVDFFRFETTAGFSNITASIESQASAGQLALEVLNSSGGTIRPGLTDPGDPNLVVAEIANAPNGVYYVKVSGETPTVKNNYTVEITVTGF